MEQILNTHEPVECTRCHKTIGSDESYWMCEDADRIEYPYCNQCHDETFMPDKGRKVE